MERIVKLFAELLLPCSHVPLQVSTYIYTVKLNKSLLIFSIKYSVYTINLTCSLIYMCVL